MWPDTTSGAMLPMSASTHASSVMESEERYAHQRVPKYSSTRATAAAATQMAQRVRRGVKDADAGTGAGTGLLGREFDTAVAWSVSGDMVPSPAGVVGQVSR